MTTINSINSNQPYQQMGNYNHVNTSNDTVPNKQSNVAPAVAVPETLKQEKVELDLKREQLKRDETARNTREVFNNMEHENARIAAYLKQAHSDMQDKADVSQPSNQQQAAAYSPGSRFHVIA